VRPRSKVKTGPREVKRLDREGLLAYSARILAARTQTVSELRGKLARKAATAADVDEVIARLKENGYLNDQRLAESFANWRRDNEGFGKDRVIRDLMSRRVPPETAKRATEKAYATADEMEMIGQFLERKYRGKNMAELFKEDKHLASAYRRLRTAGFSSSNSLRALKQYADSAGDLEGVEDESIE
jgi:regulatory protein